MSLKAYQVPKHCTVVYNTWRQDFVTMQTVFTLQLCNLLGIMCLHLRLAGWHCGWAKIETYSKVLPDHLAFLPRALCVGTPVAATDWTHSNEWRGCIFSSRAGKSEYSLITPWLTIKMHSGKHSGKLSLHETSTMFVLQNILALNTRHFISVQVLMRHWWHSLISSPLSTII